MAANALPGVLHAIAQRRPQRISELETILLSLKILPPPRDRRSLELPNTPTKSFTISWVLSYM